MKTDEIIFEAENCLKKLGFKVRYEKIQLPGIATKGGKCRVREDKVIIVNKYLKKHEKADVLMDVLASENSGYLEIPDAIGKILKRK